MRILSVRPFVRLSNAWFVTKRKNDAYRFLYYTKRSLILVFWEEEWLVGSDPVYLKFWVKRPPVRSEIVEFQSIFAPIVSAVAPSKNPINTNRKSTTRFPMSLWWTLPLTPPPRGGGSKTNKGRFPYKIVLHLKKVCYKVFLVLKLSATKLFSLA